MRLDKQLISRLEKLARLQLGDAEREKFRGDLQRILDMVDKLQELDTGGIAPLVYLNEEPGPLRPDEIGQQCTTEEALQNAPKHDNRFFRVPKVIE